MPPRDAELEVTLARIVFPPGETGLVAVLQFDAYFDESGTNPGSRLVTMVGVMATPKRWKAFSRKWWATLEAKGVKGEFKSDECIRGHGQYESWSESQRVELRALLGGLIDDHAIYASVVSVLRADFKAEILPYARNNNLWHDPYPWCARTCLEFIANTLLRANRRVGCIFDEGHGYQSRFFEYYPRLRDTHGWEKVFSGPASGKSHEYAPLQAAEWLVYESRHSTDQHVYGTRKKHQSLIQCFRKMVMEGGYFNRDKLRSVMLEIHGAIYRGQRETWNLWREQLAAEAAPAIP